MHERGSGILLHITSLPSSFGIGDLGPGAYAFADFLQVSGQRYWQVLPLNPTDAVHGNSPYSCTSAFAGNPLMISPELMVRDGFIDEGDLGGAVDFSADRVNYGRVIEFKAQLMARAFERFKGNPDRADYDGFCAINAHWLDGYALFAAIKNHQEGLVWSAWPQGLRDRDPGALDVARAEFGEEIEREKFGQFLFFKQWMALKSYCKEKGVKIVGDIPIYVNYHSADAWTHREAFKLDEAGQPTHVAGAPPDRFSATGQRWGNPVYRWDALKETGFAWWMERMDHMLALHDVVRVDHFRGLVAYWEVPAHHKSAKNGVWVEAPIDGLMGAMRTHFPDLPIIAEDLGFITDDVRAAMKRFELPGMKVLLFAFDEDHPAHPYLPHMYERNCVAYTGTHDNNTVRGWYDDEARPADRKRLSAYVGREVSADDAPWEFIRLAMSSVADTCIVPLQDALNLGAHARMNTPATTSGNWEWRVMPRALTKELAKRLAAMARTYGRIPRTT